MEMESSAFVIYDCRREAFRWSKEAKALFGRADYDRPLWEVLSATGALAVSSTEEIRSLITSLKASTEPKMAFREYWLMPTSGRPGNYRFTFEMYRPEEEIVIGITGLDGDDAYAAFIFNSFAGGAAIFSWHEGRADVLRVNQRYLFEMHMNISEGEMEGVNLLDGLAGDGRRKFIDAIENAIRTGEEQECETWRMLSSACCGEDSVCLRNTMRMVGRRDDVYLLYMSIRNISAEKRYYTSILDSERRFKAACEQAQIYYWEYDIATNEMRPCFRCMRDLNLPPILADYPESAIRAGIFPPEVADEYREWHVKLEKGVGSLEAVMPLTSARIPFHVRYTTEFDDKGRPVKAYGSATLVVDGGGTPGQ